MQALKLANVKRIAERLELAESNAARLDPNGGKIRLDAFLVWAVSLGWELPGELLAAAETAGQATKVDGETKLERAARLAKEHFQFLYDKGKGWPTDKDAIPWLLGPVRTWKGAKAPAGLLDEKLLSSQKEAEAVLKVIRRVGLPKGRRDHVGDDAE